MPDVRQVLRAHAREQGVRLDIVEKDYALSYLLAALSSTAGIGDHVVLKGGTALRKAYYPGYRFSEDLDYSTLHPGSLKDVSVSRTISVAIDTMTDRLNERGPFLVTHAPLILKQPHPGEQIAYWVRVQFPGQTQPLCRLKVEITVDEPVLLPVQERPLLHGFAEDLEVTVKVYSLAEIIAEKLRALLQSLRHLQQRGWGASRVCRDYYDLWSVLKREEYKGFSIPELVEQKCALRGVMFSSPQDFLATELLAVAQREWHVQLLPFLSQPVSVDKVLSEVQPLILALWNE